MQKTFIGPHLRRLRLERSETQAAMARALGISASYVNLLENNERSVSVAILLRLFDVYGVDWRDIAEEDSTSQLADLRAVTGDPLFTENRPEIAQIRAAIVHAPAVVQAFLTLYRAYQSVGDQLMTLSQNDTSQPTASPEAAVHDVFRRNRNHFPALETAAEAFWGSAAIPRDDIYAALKQRLSQKLRCESPACPRRRPSRRACGNMTKHGARFCCPRRLITRTGSSNWCICWACWNSAS